MSAARLALSLSVTGAVGLVAAAWLTGAAWPDVLAIAFIALMVAAWLAAALLYWAHLMEPTAVNLGERSIVAIRDALVATIGGALGLNRVLSFGWSGDLSIALLALGLLIVTAYPVAWLIQFARGRWD